MLTATLRLYWPPIALAFVATLSVSCGEGSDSTESLGPVPAQSGTSTEVVPEPGDAPTVDATLEPVIISQARLPTAHAISFDAMLQVYPVVVVGEITGVVAPYDPRPGFLGQPSPATAPPGHPKAGATIDPAAFSRPPGRLSTIYSLLVVDVVAGDSVKSRDVLNYTQIGGIWEGRAHQSEGDPVVQDGQRYLFFLEPAAEQSYTAQPFARFESNGKGELSAVADEWRYLPVVTSLGGGSVDAAKAAIAAAVERQ